MSNRQVFTHAFAAVLFAVSLWLMAEVSWRVALGVFLFVWSNNLVYSYRVKKLILSDRELRL